MGTLQSKRKLVAILSADVAGYSRLMGEDEHGTVQAIVATRKLMRAHVSRHGGRVVDATGDALLAEFASAVEALRCAVATQRAMARRNAALPERRQMWLRIGLNLGDVIEREAALYGDGVNIAARLQALGRPGGICLSGSVHDQVEGRLPLAYTFAGEQSVKNIARPVRVYHVDDATVPVPPAVVSVTAAPGNLPAALPVLHGRDDDVAAVAALVQAHRVVSIVGPGGIGKTRLAQAVAHALRRTWDGGAWMIELAPLVDPALLPAAVAQALGLMLPGRKDPRDEAIDALGDRTLLLVLDNCEHLVQAASAFVEALIGRAARVRVLATSQELLRVHDEHVYRVAALGVPATPALATATSFGAVSLFAERVGALLPGFALAEPNIADVVAICGRLDGLPLAIELAAARVPLLGVSGVRERLNERFRVLTGGSRAAMRRHQTLHETLTWSHGLLDPDERVVFRRSGVFAGGFTLNAAQRTLGDERLDDWAVLERLGALVDKSLVVVEAVEPPRYRLLESARAYALEQLAASGEEPALRDRHAAFFVAAAREAEPHLTSANRRPWLLRLRADLNNCRAALGWLVQERGDAASALRLAAALTWLAYFDGLYREGRAWLADALALPGAERHAADRAAALSGAARLAAYSGDAGVALALAEEGVHLWREVGDTRGLAYALFHEGIACLTSGQVERARRGLAESLACFRSLDDPWGVALGAAYLGTTFATVPGAEDQARPLLLEGQERFRALGDEWGRTVASHYLGSIALRSGDYAMARELTEETLANARELGDKYRIVRNLQQLAEIRIAAGQPAAALPLLHESVLINGQQGRLGDAAQQLRLLARVAADFGEVVTAARLAAVAQRHADGERAMIRDDPQRHAELLASLQQSLGETRYRDEVARAAGLSLDEAAALALSLTPAIDPAA